MTLVIDPNNLPEIQFTVTEDHQSLLDDIHHRKILIEKFNTRVKLTPCVDRISDAFLFVQQEAQLKRGFSEESICVIHKLLRQSGEYRKDTPGVSTCVRDFVSYPYFPPNPEEILVLMQKYEKRYAFIGENIEPLQQICEAYLIFVLIHPFEDGNGRTGRLICSGLMLQYGYGIFAPHLEERWGKESRQHADAFKAGIKNYLAWLSHPEDLNKYFSRFYVYFLRELLVVSDLILDS